MIEMFKSTAGALLQVMLEVCTTPLALPVALAILWRSYSRTLTVGAIPWAFCVAVLATFVFGGVAPSFLDMQQAPLKYWLRPLNDKPETQEMVRSWVSSKVLLPRTAAFAFAFFAVILIDYRKWKWSQWVGLYVVMTLTITALTFLIYFLVAIFTVPMRLDELRKFDANQHEQAREAYGAFLEYVVGLPLLAAGYSMTVWVLGQFLVTFLQRHWLGVDSQKSNPLPAGACHEVSQPTAGESARPGAHEESKGKTMPETSDDADKTMQTDDVKSSAGSQRLDAAPLQAAAAGETPSAKKPTVGILTARDHEFVAMKAMLGCARDYDVPLQGVRYIVGEVRGSDNRPHQVVLALGDMGESLAAAHGAEMISHFPSLQWVLMVGIAGGVPNPARPDEHVRLGDLVVSNTYGVVQYDNVKQSPNAVEIRSAPRPPSSTLLHYSRHLMTGVMEGRFPWEEHIRHGLEMLGWTRPPDSSDFLGTTSDHREQIAHPNDPKRRLGQPRLFGGLVASSNTLLKDAVKRDTLRDRFKAMAIEMETAGLADAAWLKEKTYFAVRGICDYCDLNKNDEWQPYAAMAAAAFLRALLESMPSVGGLR